MLNDPIVDEIHRLREQHAQEFNFDLEAIYRDLKKREAKEPKAPSSLPIKHIELTSQGS